MVKSSSHDVTGCDNKRGDNLCSFRRSASMMMCTACTIAFWGSVAVVPLYTGVRRRSSAAAVVVEIPSEVGPCSASDWIFSGDKLELVLSLPSDEGVAYVQRSWARCINTINECPECAEMSLDERYNVTWLRFKACIENVPANGSLPSGGKGGSGYVPLVNLCIPSDTTLSVCDTCEPNVTYLATGGYAGQDCQSTEYLLGLPDDSYMLAELEELCLERCGRSRSMVRSQRADDVDPSPTALSLADAYNVRDAANDKGT